MLESREEAHPGGGKGGMGKPGGGAMPGGSMLCDDATPESASGLSSKF